MSTPQTTIYICSGVRLNSRYEHSIHFDNEESQLAYFSGKVVKTLAAYSYVRRSWTLKVEADMPSALTWNYLYFRNHTNSRYYFYFINKVEYVNDNTVELTLELDVLQTYLFSFELLRCFVERQHARDDTIGANTLDEGLDTGEMVNYGVTDYDRLKEMCVMAMSSYNLTLAPHKPSEDDTVKYTANYSFVDNVYSKIGIYATDAVTSFTDEDVDMLTDFLDGMDDVGMTDSILTMWMCPTILSGRETDATTTGFYNVSQSADTGATYTFTKPTTVGGYTPKNNKLFCYPYNYLYVSNNNGNNAIYRYERWCNSNNCEFDITGSRLPDGGVTLYPKRYNTQGTTTDTDSYEEGLSIKPYPTCAWNSDAYKVWLAQNQNQLELAKTQSTVKLVGGVATAAASLATGNLAGAAGGAGLIYSGVMDIQNQLAEKEDRRAQPNQARGGLSASLCVANDKFTFTFYNKVAPLENLQIIDDFFTRYGYRVSRIVKPDIYARNNFTYVKTKDCHVYGNICNEDICKIEDIFNNGITWWRNGDSIGDYTLTNAPRG